jgi:hypothetical protein
MKLKFIISKYELAAQIFHHRMTKPQDFPFWRKVEEKLWLKYKNEPAFYFIYPKHLDWALQIIRLEIENGKMPEKIGKKILKIYKEIIDFPEFKKILKETKSFLDEVKKQWQRNEPIVLKYFKETLGLKIFPGITIIILHPKIGVGKAVPNKKMVLWGHHENWKNYSTTYLAHEILHILTEKRYKDYNLIHAIIELAADNELRIKLNKHGGYFKENGYPVGHKNLRKLEKKILPLWKSYLKNPNNIIVLESQIKKALA